MGQLNIFASPLPFSNKRVQANAPLGSSVQYIVDQICPENLKSAGVGAIVTINGDIILQKHWKHVKPKEGTLINVRIVPTGGGSGKSPLATLLSVVVLIAAPYAGASFLTALAPMGAGITTTSAVLGGLTITSGMIGGALSSLGLLLVSALAPPPKPSSAGIVNNPAGSPTQFIQGAQNALNPFGVVPINLGINRMVPPLAGRTFTESYGHDQFVRQLFTWGVGNAVTLSDLKFGESSIDDFTDIELEHRLNGDLNQGTNLYADDPFEEDFNVLLQQVDSYTQRATQSNVDEAVVDFTFPSGLCTFGAQTGKRKEETVELELQYALSGVSPLVWTPYVDAYSNFAGFSGAVSDVKVTSKQRSISGTLYYVGYRMDVVIIDSYSGVISILKGLDITDDPATVGTAPPSEHVLPENAIRLASALVLTKQGVVSGTATTTIETFHDDRDSSLYGTTFENSTDFVPTHIGTTISISVGKISSVNSLKITQAQVEALRVSQRVVFPARGTYQIRVRRVTDDTNSDKIIDKVYLTAIKSFTYQAPVTEENVNGTAMRIKGTDQLNGSVENFNAIVGSVIPDYDVATDTWINRVSNNPASLYRFVLQGCGNAKVLSDEKVNLDDLKDWHAYCITQGYTYNRVIDYETNVSDVLGDIASAGSASPAIVDGKRTVAIDRIKNDIVQIVTPRNSWEYSGEMIYPDLPHAFRVQFRNKDKGYIQDERIVYDDGYNEDNATLFEVLEIQSCTDSDLAFKTGRRHIAAARLRPETHTFMMDIENLVAVRGDRIKLAHDIPIIGVGDGRVKTVSFSGGSPNLITAITIDDTITIPSVSTYYVRIRLQDGSLLYKQINTTVGDTKTLTFTTPFAQPYTSESPPVALLNDGDLLYVVEAGGEVDLIITKIEPQDDLSARITAQDYAPAIFDAESTTIPSWSSHITTPLEFIRPLPPTLLTDQCDENAMLKNSDGSLITRAIFTLDNPNDNSVDLVASVRVTGTEIFTLANVLESTPNRIVLTGLQDNTRYDIFLRYRRALGSVVSLPLQINSYLFVGASSIPSTPANFDMSVTNGLALFTWDVNPEIDIAYYTMEYSGVYSGAAWGTAQIVQEKIYENRVTLPFQGGTYLLKAVDFSGNESDDAAVVITYDASQITNAIETLTEEPSFTGTKDNTFVQGTALVLADTDLTDGYYYFAETIDLTAVFVSVVSASVVASGTFVNDVFDMPDVFLETDMFGSGQNDIFADDDIFAVDDVFGIGVGAWSVELQYRTTDGSTSSSPVAWSDWTKFVAGNISFRGIQFRLKMTSLAQNISPSVTTLEVVIDMPDRIERGTGLSCDATLGATVTYAPAFKDNPSVGITLQNAATDDKIVFSAKTASGFSFTVYNQTLAANVTRTYDYIISGYGRVVT